MVSEGRIDLEDEDISIDPESMLRVFAEIAEQGWRLTARAENAISDALPALNLHLPEGPFLRAGLVRAPFPTPIVSDEHYWLVSGASRAPGPALRAFAR